MDGSALSSSNIIINRFQKSKLSKKLTRSTIPLAFLAGFTWPAEALPEPLQWLRWLSPSTAAIQASLRLNQAGAPIAAVLPHLAWLGLLALASWAAVLALGRGRRATI